MGDPAHAAGILIHWPDAGNRPAAGMEQLSFHAVSAPG
jgi:hypothetical protein